MGKKLPPIIIITIAVFFVSIYLIGLLLSLPFTRNPIEYFFLLIGIFSILAIIITLIYTLIMRLKEIKEEDKDDLSQY